MLRKIRLRTIPLSRCGSAGGAAELPGAGVVPDTPRSMPLIFFSIEAAVCRQTPLYFGQLSAKSDTRDHKPYPTAPTTAQSKRTMTIEPMVRGIRQRSRNSHTGSRQSTSRPPAITLRLRVDPAKRTYSFTSLDSLGVSVVDKRDSVLF